MNVGEFLTDDKGWHCETCHGYGGLTIAGVTYLELTCPTCHGQSRGMPIEKFFEEMEREYNAERQEPCDPPKYHVWIPEEDIDYQYGVRRRT